MKRLLVKKDSYYDSVFLMLVSRELKSEPDIDEAIVAMGTDMNRELLGDMGFDASALSGATANDLLVAVDAASEAACAKAAEKAEELIKRKKAKAATGSVPKFGSLDAALKATEGANLAVISLPGAFAAREARKALERGLHVMLFSDNVSLDEEVALKEFAASRGLLVMGPDCGTSIVNGHPICFANVVARGRVGIVAAAGTGLQEVSCLVDRLGSGVSQGIGTGGRDLKNARVGGATMLPAIDALVRDPGTRVIALVSKPPAPETAAKVVERLKVGGKDAVVHFVGSNPAKDRDGVVRFARSLEETATLACSIDQGREIAAPEGGDPATVAALAAREASRIGKGQKWLRGLYTGGTLADESLFLLDGPLGGVWSNNQLDPAKVPPDPHRSAGHTIVDLGDDCFTVGRPHPMIEPSTRVERLAREGDDPELACLLLDCVIGYGSHPDPAGAMAGAIAEAKAKAAARGGYLPVVASVTGTAADAHGFSAQRAALERAGCVVMPSNRAAAALALEIMRKVAK